MKYNTKNKTEVIEMLKENVDKHLTILEMEEILSKRNKRIPIATLYRIIDSLLKEGKIKKYVIDDKAACFQYIGNSIHNHFHLICSKCGKVVHLKCDEVNELVEHISCEHHFKVDESKVNLYGICKDCLGEK